MRLALMSDIHANWHALRACVADARARGVDAWAFLGDMVGYGAQPREVLDFVMGEAARSAVVLLGNHDQAALQPPAQIVSFEDAGAQYTHGMLTHGHRQFLASLPYAARVGSCWLVHASAHQPGTWQYVQDEHSAMRSLDAACSQEGITHVFGGHVHHQTLYYRGSTGRLMPFKPTAGVSIPTPVHRRWIATIGSVGQPRDGNPRAMYAIFDDTQRQLLFCRVAYDHLAAARAVRAAGLPEFFASRLEQGR